MKAALQTKEGLVKFALVEIPYALIQTVIDGHSYEFEFVKLDNDNAIYREISRENLSDNS